MVKKNNKLSIENHISETRTLRKEGIRYMRLSYQNPQLAELENQLPAGTRVVIEVDPQDIASIRVYNPLNNIWFNVPAVDQTYANELTLYKHRVIQAWASRSREANKLALMKAKEDMRKILADVI